MSYSPVRVVSSIDDSTFLVEFLTKRSYSLFKFLGQGDRNVASTVGLERLSQLRGFLGKRGEFPHFFRKALGLRRLDRLSPEKRGSSRKPLFTKGVPTSEFLSSILSLLLFATYGSPNCANPGLGKLLIPKIGVGILF